MQRPAGTPSGQPGQAICPGCRGEKKMVVNGKDVVCPRCRGTGIKGYLTK